MIADTVERRGLGEELAGGSLSLAAGRGEPGLSMSVKGLELPAFDPRGMTGQGLAFATSNRGGCHTRANMLASEIVGVPALLDRFATNGKSRPVIAMQDLNATLDSLVGCKFAAFAVSADLFARLLGSMLGEYVATEALLLAGERIWNAERLFNLRAGFTRADDTLPARLLNEPGSMRGPVRGMWSTSRRCWTSTTAAGAGTSRRSHRRQAHRLGLPRDELSERGGRTGAMPAHATSWAAPPVHDCPP